MHFLYISKHFPLSSALFSIDVTSGVAITWHALCQWAGTCHERQLPGDLAADAIVSTPSRCVTITYAGMLLDSVLHYVANMVCNLKRIGILYLPIEYVNTTSVDGEDKIDYLLHKAALKTDLHKYVSMFKSHSYCWKGCCNLVNL